MERLKLVLSNVWLQFLLFCSAMWLIFVHLEINRHIKDMIIGFHYWRKSDTYAQISNYYYNGLNFFDHSIYYNQLQSNGHALAEFPLFYYFIAFQQQILGHHQIIAKINWILMLFLGCFALFKIANYFLNHVGFSFVISILLFISPIFTLYSIDFLPDPIALYLVLIGLWLLIVYIEKEKKYWLYISMFLIGFAGMMKPFFLIPFIALTLTLLGNHFIFKKKNKLKISWLFILPFALTGIWFIYVNWYNGSVQSDYFLANTRAFWDFSTEENLRTLTAINDRWIPDYMHPMFLIPFLILVGINLLWWTKKSILINLFYLFAFLGCIAFYILFFNMFEYHDYYIYPTLFLIPLTAGKFIYHLQQAIKSSIFNHIFSILLMVLLFLGLDNTFDRIQQRRTDRYQNGTMFFENYVGLDTFLIKHGIEKEDLVITFSDKSPSFALSLIDRKGWSGFQTRYKLIPIETLIEWGAEYLIVNEREEKDIDSLIDDPFLEYPIADTNGIFIYDLKPYSK